MADIEQIMEPLMRDRARIEREEQDLKLQLAKLHEEKRTITKVLRAAGLVESTYAQRAKNGKLDDGTIDRVRQAIRTEFPVGERFTRTMLDQRIEGIGTSTIERVLGVLRTEGVIRMTGKVKGGGRGYTATELINA